MAKGGRQGKSLRWNEENVNAQCVPCNQHKSGNLIDYRIGLIEKIGLDRVEWLEGPQAVRKYTCDEMRELIVHYKTKVKTMRAAA